MADLRNVYDFFCPSPLSLKELACVEVALNLWRREIRLYLTPNGTLRERYPQKKTSLRCLISEIPRTILPTIERAVEQLKKEIPWWLSFHISKGIVELSVLNRFLDFVCDYDGSIHYRKTAERFMACQGISDDVKFKMACEYCLEDDIFRIWPRVWWLMSANGIDANTRHEAKLYYWICRLKNQPHDVDLRNDSSSIEEHFVKDFFEDLSIGDWFAVEYFLNSLPAGTRMECIIFMTQEVIVTESSKRYDSIDAYLKYVLAKLNEAELKKLVNDNGDKLIIFADEPERRLRTWSYIKNEMTCDGFCRLFKFILKEQTENASAEGDSPYYRELWASTPDHLKHAAIRDVLLVVDKTYFDRNFEAGEDRRSISFLLAVLSDTSIEDRRRFWNEYWETLIYDIRFDDLCDLIKLCFNYDENQIAEFKKDLASKYYHKIERELKNLFEGGCLKELEEFLTFLIPNEQTIKEIRLQLLQEQFISPDVLIREAKSFNEFIDNAYEDKNLVTKFKNKLLLIPDMKITKCLKNSVCSCEFLDVMNFVDIFATSDEIALQIRKCHIMPAVRYALSKPRLLQYLTKSPDNFEVFVDWLFKDCDDIVQFFKETLDIDAIIQGWIQKKADFVNDEQSNGVDFDWFANCFQTAGTYLTYRSRLSVREFLEWYFVTPAEFRKFEEKYAHNYVFYRLLS